MGLAASQARFLAITARKMNCEFQSMQIAQEKLSTTRDLQRAADEYQNSLDATKLVWDAQDLGTYDLSYDLMMRPSTLNNFTPYLITDPRGKVVLSEQMFQAAMKAGIIDANGEPTLGRKNYTYISDFSTNATDTRSSLSIRPFEGKALDYDDDGYPNSFEVGSRNEFLYQLGQFNQLDGSMVKNILELGPAGYNKSGIGGPLFDKSTANALETNDFINYLKSAKAENVKTVGQGKKFPYNVSSTDGKSYEYEFKSVNTEGRDIHIEVYTYAAGEKIKSTTPLYYRVDSDASWTDENGTEHKGIKAETSGRINGKIYNEGDNIPPTDPVEEGYTFKNGDVAPFAFTVAVETKAGKNEKIYNVGSAFKDAFGQNANANSTKTTSIEKDKFSIVCNGKALSDRDLELLTLGDILSGNYTIVYNGNDFSAKYSTMLKELAEILGYGDSTHITGLNVDNQSNEALNIAYTYTNKELLGTKAKLTEESSRDPAVLCTKAQSQNNVVVSTQTDKNGNKMSSISLTNLMRSYLTNFARAIDGMQTPYYVDPLSTRKSRYVTNDYDYTFIIKNDGAMLDEIDLNADFYNMLYNVIATSGACTNEMLMNTVTEKSMLHEAIKNGSLFVTTLSDDGYFYQKAYSMTDCIAEVPDEDAIARAEREYQVTKSRLNTKEETLELKMKNLDMEISALTTEFDTVKNLISKGVEKVFTMFST